MLQISFLDVANCGLHNLYASVRNGRPDACRSKKLTIETYLEPFDLEFRRLIFNIIEISNAPNIRVLNGYVVGFD
jgi:hypothetical protein